MGNAGIYEFRKVRLFKHLYEVILCMNGISLKDKEKYMYWVVEERMVCPRTGTTFIHVLTVKNLRLIIWYKGDYFISPGSVLVTGPFGIAVDGRLRKLHILRAFPYTPPFWSSFLANSTCPGNDGTLLTRCEHRQDCVFALCPYGAIAS